MQLNTINLSDNIEYIRTLPDNSIDAIITDSPYGLGKEPIAAALITDWLTNGYHEIKGTGFMGKKWDAFVPQPALWKECYRVLKPGGYLLSFFGTRTYDWGTLSIRLAGFEIRDCIQWIYGNGFPKGKACLKPANEPICVARKPGKLQMLNIDECRIDTDWSLDKNFRENGRTGNIQDTYFKGKDSTKTYHNNPNGRYPSNVILDESSADLLDEQTGLLTSGGGRKGEVGKRNYLDNTHSNSLSGPRSQAGEVFIDPVRGAYTLGPAHNDIGGASRYFYVAKASPSERKGLTHPTIKPVKLMVQLVKLYCPVGGVVLDPHMGSGTTAIACLESYRKFIGIDNDEVSHREANDRVERWNINNPDHLFTENA